MGHEELSFLLGLKLQRIYGLLPRNPLLKEPRRLVVVRLVACGADLPLNLSAGSSSLEMPGPGTL